MAQDQGQGPILDTSFQTMQRDLFASGMVAQIGVNAFAIWQAIKAHADYQTGVCWPSIRRLMELTGLANATVQKAVATLQEARLLRVEKQGRRNNYIARERMDLRIGDILICTVVVDYVPAQLRETLPRLKAALEGSPVQDTEGLMAQVEILPGPGFAWDQTAGSLKREIPSPTLGAAMSGAPLPAGTEGPDTDLCKRLRGIQAKALERRSKAQDGG